MKKYLKFALAAFILLASGTAFVSCGDNNNEKEVVIPSEVTVYEGTTKTYPVENPDEVYESTTGTYSVEYDETSKTANLIIYNANFLQGMPELGAMTFPGIDWTFDSKTDCFRLKKDGLTPKIGERPFPMFPISNFTATENVGTSLEVSFICTYREVPYQVIFSGSPKK